MEYDLFLQKVLERFPKDISDFDKSVVTCVVLDHYWEKFIQDAEQVSTELGEIVDSLKSSFSGTKKLPSQLRPESF